MKSHESNSNNCTKEIPNGGERGRLMPAVRKHGKQPQYHNANCSSPMQARLDSLAHGKSFKSIFYGIGVQVDAVSPRFCKFVILIPTPKPTSTEAPSSPATLALSEVADQLTFCQLNPHSTFAARNSADGAFARHAGYRFPVWRSWAPRMCNPPLMLS